MINVLRNLLVATLSFVVALLLAAAGQVAFELALPTLSGQILGVTDLNTYALLLLVVFFCILCGVIVPRWLSSAAPFVWFVPSLVALYSAAHLAMPYLYRCVPGVVAGCWVVQSPFVLAAVALAVGCYLHRVHKRSRYVV